MCLKILLLLNGSLYFVPLLRLVVHFEFKAEKIFNAQLDLLVHACDPSRYRSRQEDWEFKAYMRNKMRPGLREQNKNL